MGIPRNVDIARAIDNHENEFLDKNGKIYVMDQRLATVWSNICITGTILRPLRCCLTMQKALSVYTVSVEKKNSVSVDYFLRHSHRLATFRLRIVFGSWKLGTDDSSISLLSKTS